MREILVEITDITTGEVRYYKDEGLFDEAGIFEDYMWSLGNYGCDCNRRLFFARVKGEEEDWDSGCCREQYKVRVFAVVYDDADNNDPRAI